MRHGPVDVDEALTGPHDQRLTSKSRLPRPCAKHRSQATKDLCHR